MHLRRACLSVAPVLLTATVLMATAQAAPARPRSASWTYTAPAGVTGTYPQVFTQFLTAPHAALDREVVGGVLVGPRGTENRVSVHARDLTGRPVALSVFVSDGPNKPLRSAVVCGGTPVPIVIAPKGALQVNVTAGSGCAAPSAPTRGTITVTWSTAPPAKRKG